MHTHGLRMAIPYTHGAEAASGQPRPATDPHAANDPWSDPTQISLPDALISMTFWVGLTRICRH